MHIRYPVCIVQEIRAYVAVEGGRQARAPGVLGGLVGIVKAAFLKVMCYVT